MKTSTALYQKLKKAYSQENLHRITTHLIQLHKNKNYEVIKKIYHSVFGNSRLEEVTNTRRFSQLIMLYHPDKGGVICETLDTLYEKQAYKQLEEHAHILCLDNLESFKPSLLVDHEAIFKAEYAWDQDQTGFYYSSEESENVEEYFYTEEIEEERSFYNAIKRQVYGHLEVEFPSYYLEDFEEFDLTNQALESLDGIAYCKHMRRLDLSSNSLCDIRELWELNELEELCLANNQVNDIDVLDNLVFLKVVDLTNNRVEDISPLFELEHLSYVNLVGNQVKQNQIKYLKAKGIIVLH
ncbi:hypothetical protein BKI52_04665 [marine bacterium AO1-C]|nr:hypothetical protein BKI52_04665 [marine bacterium AO1-C]